ncbi:MAG: DUF308 domain-containing protein [Tannerellaceae bacterium]|nr:DUF308 domain-containing protein [Tannerellaceae bacterium]
MITIHYSVWRSLVAVAMGLLFIMWPQESVSYLIVMTGGIFILAGLCSFFVWRRQRVKSEGWFSPSLLSVVAVGSILLGIWLVVSPDFFIALFGRVCGAVLVIAGVQQVISLLAARKRYAVAAGYYILPALILIAGAVILVYPVETVANTFVLLGSVSLFYGVNELISWYKFRPKKAEPLSVEEVEAEEVADGGA